MKNAEATKERILDAALDEFSTYGIAGARVDRIAQAAGCNKNLIYIYFESKETLFITLLKKHLTRVYDEIPFTPEDLPGYAMRLFDLAMAHPDLMRLVAWFGLERTTKSLPERGSSFHEKVEALTQAQERGAAGQRFPPAFLLTAILALATAWTSANPFGPSLDPDAANDPDTLRKNVADVVKLLSQAKARRG